MGIFNGTMQVHDTHITSREDRLVFWKVQEHQFGFDFLSDIARLVDVGHHETFLDVLIFQSANLDLHVFTSLGVVDGSVTGVENLGDLEVFAYRTDLAVVVHLNAALLDFSGQVKPLVTDFVHNGDT